jgi:para-nitrobenzyl esterase
VRATVTLGNIAPQPATALFPKISDVSPSEDCLSLNIWAPEHSEPGDRLAVMVWIHGGGYIVGASAQPVYNGQALAESGDLVVVTLNYRLGALGFLDLTHLSNADTQFESNLGLKDIVAALQWVQANIDAFGGNPDDVTLFGQSAGAASITTLMTVPAAKNLFHKAIAQSPPATSVYGTERSVGVANEYLNLLGLLPSEAVEALHAMDAQQLVAPTMQLLDHIATNSPGTLAFAPIVDGDFITDYPENVFARGEQHPIPLLIGSTKNEAALFKMMKSPLMPTSKVAVEQMFRELVSERPELDIQPQHIYDAYPDYPRQQGAIQISSDAGIGMPVTWLAEAHSRVASTYVYRFDQATPLMKLAGLGAVHASELAYVFGTIPPKVELTKRQLIWFGGRRTAQRVSARMKSHWIEFAQSATADWPAYSAGERATFVFNRRDSVQLDPNAHRREAWGATPVSFR